MRSTVSASELADLLEHPDAKADVTYAISSLKLNPDALNQADAERVFERLGEASGLKGIVARFLLAQVPLLFTGDEDPDAFATVKRMVSERSASARAPTTADAANREVTDNPAGALRAMSLFGSSGRKRAMSIDTERRVERLRSKRYPLETVVSWLAVGVPIEDARNAVRMASAKVPTGRDDSFTLIEIDQIFDVIAEISPRWRGDVQLVRTRLRTGAVDL